MKIFLPFWYFGSGLWLFINILGSVLVRLLGFRMGVGIMLCKFRFWGLWVYGFMVISCVGHLVVFWSRVGFDSDTGLDLCFGPFVLLMEFLVIWGFDACGCWFVTVWNFGPGFFFVQVLWCNFRVVWLFFFRPFLWCFLPFFIKFQILILGNKLNLIKSDMNGLDEENTFW